MSAYYPTQGSAYGAGQPIVYASANAGYNAGYQPQYLGQPDPVVVVPSQGSHHSHRSRHGSHHDHGHHHHHSSHNPTVIAPAAPVMQPSYAGGGYVGTYGPAYYDISFGERIRRFFGLAPRGPFKYRNNKGTWGFMGYSRRQRYSDARTGAEVDRKGRPVYRV